VPDLDDSRQRIRLADTYAAMSDGELLRLARNAESLTDVAWDALEDELDRRHLELPEDSEPVHTLDFRTLVTIRQFRDLPEALLAKGCLESAGIECFLRDDNLVRLDWFISNFVGGIKLCVRPEDAQTARDLLDEDGDVDLENALALLGETGSPEEIPHLLEFIDLENETETIRNYRDRVRQCEALGEFSMAEHIREILMDEQDHQIALATALGQEVPHNS